MQISGLFQKITMPNLNVGLIWLAVCIFGAFYATDSVATSPMASCLPCYACVSTDSNGSCTSCVYDGNTNCILKPNDCNATMVCLKPQVLNQSTCKCECERIQRCMGDATFNSDTCSCECNLKCFGDTELDETACECVAKIIRCEDGYYLSGRECKVCPDRDALQRFNCGVHSSNGGANGITDCYKESDSGMASLDTGGMLKCTYSNDIGTYELESDCYYVDDRGGQIIEIGSTAEDGSLGIDEDLKPGVGVIVAP